MAAEITTLPSRRTGRSIEVRGGDLAGIVRESEQALLDAGAELYQRSGQLVRVVRFDSPAKTAGIKRDAGSHVIVPVSREFLTLELSRSTVFERFDARTKKLVATDPPPKVAATLLASAGEWRFRTLAGIVAAPTLRRDGSLLDKPGFDADSCLYAAFEAGSFPPINPNPSRDDAAAALAMLRDVFAESAFQGGRDSAHASVMVAAIITAVLRSALDTAPAFGVSAHKAGSGKTTAAKAPAQVALGHDPPVFSPTDDETELAKSILAILMAGDRCLLLDNLEHPLNSAALCAVLTAATYRGRILGQSQTVSVPTAATWLLTGNHLELVGDLTSRTLLCVLDPQVEHPDRRAFRRDLTAHVLAQRGELVRAALTIPLAYVSAGCPPQSAERSRFADWDRLCRNPLLWLGAADPLDTQAELRAADPVREGLVALLHAWHDVFGDVPTTVARAVETASGAAMSVRPALMESLQAVAGERSGEINSRRLGRYLSRHVRRIEDGLRFEDAGTDPVTCRRKFSVTSVISVIPNPSRASVSDKNWKGITNIAENAGNEVCSSCSGEGCKWCRP